MGTAPASASEAMDMVHAGLAYVATADTTAMGADTQARGLHLLEQATSIATARTSILAAFTAGQGYCADADYSPRAWLINKTRVSKGAAVGYTAWVRRAAEHPEVFAALAAGQMSESYARMICLWTGKLARECRAKADEILLGAALGGADLRDLAGLAAEILARSEPADPDGKDEVFQDGTVRLETTFDGAGILTGDLSPECTAVVQSVLDSLSAPEGAEDTRSYAQRYHDALHEAMQRLVTAGLLPERAGQPVKVVAPISLADLLMLEGSSALLEEWTEQLRARWAGHRAGASAGGSIGGAWLVTDRGLAEATVVRYVKLARSFLSRYLTSRGGLESLSGADVVAFLLAESERLSVGSVKGRVGELRSLLRFLYLQGLTPRPMAAAVPPVAGWRDTGVPKAIPVGDVQRLLDGCDRGDPVGVRDYAILMLVARLGLRSAEVARLELGDIDWRAGQITLRGKANQQDGMPLPVVISSFQDRHVVDLGGHVEGGVVDVTAVAA